VSVKVAIESEKIYFSQHPVYSTMPQGLLGIGNLTTKLSRILFTHIKHTLPEIMKEIRDKIKETESDLQDLGEPMPSEGPEKMQMLWAMTTEFIQTYRNTIGGKYDNKRSIAASAQKAELSGGAKIKMSFYNLYSEFFGFQACSEYSDLHIQKAI
jgi:hypothetical protein